MRVVCLWLKNSAPNSRSARDLAELCFKLSPQICLRKNEAVFIEVGKCHRLYSEDGFKARAQVLLRRLQQTAEITFADSIAEAWVLAKYKTNQSKQLPLAALIDFADPFEQDFILQKYIHKMILALTALGIKTIEQFKRLPSAEITSRFGSAGLLCRQRLNSEVTMPWPFWKPEEIISEKVEFPYFEFYGELEPILFELKKQLDHIFQRLWARNLKAQSLQVKIFCEKGSQNPYPVRIFDFDFLYPQSVTKGALNIIKERLVRDFEKNRIRSSIEGLQTTVMGAVGGTTAQKNLLHNHEEVAEQRSSLLGQLTEIHGAENIFHAVLTEDRRPEKSWTKETAEMLYDKKNNISKTTQPPYPIRPHYLLKVPERIEVTAGYIHLRKKRYLILHWSETVERLTGGWLDRPTDLKNSFERNYYQAQVEGPIGLFIFQTPDQKFYLHGYFG